MPAGKGTLVAEHVFVLGSFRPLLLLQHRWSSPVLEQHNRCLGQSSYLLPALGSINGVNGGAFLLEEPFLPEEAV